MMQLITAAAYNVEGQKHFNTVENFLAIFNHGVIGTYHHASEAHLARYTAEFGLRCDARKDSDADRDDQSLRGTYGKLPACRRPHAIAV
jgi:hypothetical protein